MAPKQVKARRKAARKRVVNFMLPPKDDFFQFSFFVNPHDSRIRSLILELSGKSLRWLLCLVFIFSALSASFHASAEEAEEAPRDFWHRPTLTGSWGGARQSLANHGVNFDFVYTTEVVGNVSGGVEKKVTSLNNFDLVLDVDFERLVHWKGASLHLYGVGNEGGSASDNAGDTQGLSNIESPDAWRLYEAWLQQNFYDDRLSFLAGLHDLNADFDSIETAHLFINSSHGIGPDYSQSGLNGPSIFPNTGLGFRVAATPLKPLYIQSGIFDGVPGNPNDPESPVSVSLNGTDGALIVSEIGFLPGELGENRAYGKFAVGGWYYTASFDDLSDVDANGNPLRRSHNFGVYGFGESLIFRENKESDQGLSVFGRVGYANPKINRFEYYLGSGLSYKGVFPGRDDDLMGFAVATALNGQHYRTAQTIAGTPSEKAEITLEWTYQMPLTPWLSIQPDVQWIVNPDTQAGRENSLNLGSVIQIVL